MYGSEVKLRFLIWMAVLCGGGVAWADPADDQYTVAANHYAQSRWQLAADEFQAFLDEFPEHARSRLAHFFLGESLLQLNQHQAARQRFLLFLEEAPYHDYARQARFRAAEAAFLSGDHDTASREFEQLQAVGKSDALTVYILAYRGEIALAHERIEDAERTYREAIQQFPEGPLKSETRFGLARALELKGDAAEAQRFYQFLADNTKGDLLDDARLRLGILLYKQGHYQQATKHLAAFEDQLSGSPLRNEARYWLGMAALDSGNPRDAVRVFATAQDIPADHPLAAALHFGWAEALRSEKHSEAAGEHYERVFTEWPDSAWADDALLRLIRDAFEGQVSEHFQRYVATFEAEHAHSELAGQVAQLRGRWSLREQDYAVAVQQFQRLLAKELGDATFQQANKYYLAVALIGVGRHEEVLSTLDSISDSGEAPERLQHSILVARATALVSLERYAQAIEPLRSYLDSRPEGADASSCRAKLLICHTRLSNTSEARQVLEVFRREDSDESCYLPTLHFVAEVAAERGDSQLAREFFETLLAERSHDYVAKGLAGVGALQLSDQQIDEGIATLRRLLDEHPDCEAAPAAALMLARALEQAERHDEALATYLDAADRYIESEIGVTAKFEAAKLLQTLGQLTVAADLLQELVEARADYSQLDVVLYQLAWMRSDLGDTPQAAICFERLRSEFPDSRYRTDATYRLAEQSVQRGEVESARTLIDELMTTELESRVLGHVLYLQGQLEIQQDRWAEAMVPLERLVSELPESSLRLSALFWIAEAKFRLEDYEAAETRLLNLAEESEGRQTPWAPMIPLRRAQILAQRHEWAMALKLAESSSAQFPEFGQQYEVDYLRGRCLSALARFSEAREAFTTVVRSASARQTETAAMAQWMIGESYFHQKRYREALRAYHRVASLYSYPQWRSLALLQAGKCHELSSQWGEAVKLYTQLLQEDANSDYATEAARRLSVAQQQAQRS